MGKAKNKVIDGVHKGKSISTNLKNELTINESFTKTISLNSCTCKEYLLLTEDTTKSASSAMARGLLGAILIGAPGLLAGLSAKNIGTCKLCMADRGRLPTRKMGRTRLLSLVLRTRRVCGISLPREKQCLCACHALVCYGNGFGYQL